MRAVEKAASIIRGGGVVVYPTETVYGLGADALNPAAIHRVIDLKGRPAYQPISIAVSDLHMLEEVAHLQRLEFIERWLPGPVTVLLRKKDIVPDLLTSSSPLVGIRIPDHTLALELIRRTGPITSTSANISGEPAPCSPQEVKMKADYLLEGGPCKYKEPSTIVDLTSLKIIRRGALYGEVREWISKHID